MACTISEHQGLHSGYANLHDTEHIVFEMGLDAEYESPVHELVYEVCERLGMPIVNISYFTHPGLNGAYMPGWYLMWLSEKGHLETIAHELAHHINYERGEEEDDCDSHGDAFIAAFLEAAKLIAEVLGL